MLEIKLNLDGEEKTIVQPTITGRAFRDTVEIQKKMKDNKAEDGVSVEQLDELVDYVCGVYGNRFTRDQFYDGIDAGELMSTIQGTILKVLGKTTEAMQVKNA